MVGGPQFCEIKLVLPTFRGISGGLTPRARTVSAEPYGKYNHVVFVEYWKVGASSSSLLPMDANDVSKHLTEDWMPSLPVAIKDSFLGWPSHLLQLVPPGNNALAISDLAGRAERQWKGFMSWMLGVAGTRQVLRREGYRWIAPLSAFYEDAKLPVDVGQWPSAAGIGRLIARGGPDSTVRLRPDYIALRFPAPSVNPESLQPDIFWQSAELIVAESKGTQAALGRTAKCPPNWKSQVDNVRLFNDGQPLSAHRNMVVATRVNPNAIRPKTRRIQIRAWNSAVIGEALPPSAAVEIANASLFGLAKTLRLTSTAAALARAPWRRRPEAGGDVAMQDPLVDSEALKRSRDASLHELQRFSSKDVSRRVEIRSGFDGEPIAIVVAPALVELMEALSTSTSPVEAAAALVKAERALVLWDVEVALIGYHGRQRASRMGLLYTFPDKGRPHLDVQE